MTGTLLGMRGMFVTGPLGAGDLVNDRPLRIRGAAGRTFGALTGQVLNPTMRGYVRDLTAPYGVAVREDLLDQGAGHSYVEMCLPLLAELVPEDRPADLLVLATAVPDIRDGRSTATVLSWHCAGAPMAFTVCDQGVLSAFTALRLIDGYARTGGCERAVLLVAEQPVLYHELPEPTPVPERAAAVGVVLEAEDGGEALSVRRHPEVTPDSAADVLAAEVARLPGEPAVILGGGLAGPVDGQPLTGVWLELARRLPQGGQVLLADYDPVLRCLFSAVVSFC